MQYTVGELIAALQKFPAGAPVIVNMGRNELANSHQASEVCSIMATKNKNVKSGDPRWIPEEYGYHLDDEDYTEPELIVTISA